MTREEREAIWSLCELVEHIMCRDCNSSCTYCTMTDWIKDIRRPFMKEKGDEE